MEEYKNLKVYNSFVNNKVFKIFGTIGSVVAIIWGGITVGKKVIDKKHNEDVSIVEEYYGNESKETLILDYIKCSEELQKIGFKEYEVSTELLNEYRENNYLNSPEEIMQKISRLKELDKNIDNKDINSLSEYVALLVNLKLQFEYINIYLYNEGYSVANANITNATKKYAGEVYGIDPSGIEFRQIPNGSGSDDINMKYNGNSYTVDKFFSDKDETIRDGVNKMIATNTRYDDDMTDNKEYNEARNDIIFNTLVESAKINTEVDNEDLYGESFGKHIK